ncbi:MAG TPA: hypothetical protein VGF99_11425 [Myxococcota bacterium]
MRRVAAACVVFGLLAAGCPPQDGDAKDLAVWSAAEARRAIEKSLVDLEKGDLDSVLRRFCDDGPDGRRRTEALLRIAVGKHLEVRTVEPAWVGKEPYFYVEVGFGAAAGDAVFHGFGVRVRDGCLDRAVGASDIAHSP